MAVNCAGSNFWCYSAYSCGIRLGKLGLVTGNGFIDDAVANGQVLAVLQSQAFQRGYVNVVLRIINNAVIRQITFHFGGNFEVVIPVSLPSPTSSPPRAAASCYLSVLGQLIIINLQFAEVPSRTPLPPLF